MLVLNRRLGEEIRIGRDIRLKVLAIRGNRVRLGFTAPADVDIVRTELDARVRDFSAAAELVTDSSEEP